MENLETNLIPVIIQHSENKDVLMLGYMNNEALKKTVKSKHVWFYSRSKKRLWEKGESSGNYLKLIDIKSDCDKDALLILAKPEGPTCHTGKDSCFYNDETNDLKYSNPTILNELFEIIDERKNNPRLQVNSVDQYVEIMNNLKLANPKMMDVAVPANLKGLTLNQVKA